MSCLRQAAMGDTWLLPGAWAEAHADRLVAGVCRKPQLPPAKMIYVDALFVSVSRNPQARAVGSRNGHQWSHLWADTREELDALAVSIGLRPEWWQAARPIMPSGHYDLTPGKRAAAISAGATEADLFAWFREASDRRLVADFARLSGGIFPATQMVAAAVKRLQDSDVERIKTRQRQLL